MTNVALLASMFPFPVRMPRKIPLLFHKRVPGFCQTIDLFSIDAISPAGRLRGNNIRKSPDTCPAGRGECRGNLQLANALPHVTENSCEWRGLPENYGIGHIVSVRMNRRCENGVLQRLLEELQQEGEHQSQARHRLSGTD